jgi:hypothetical protein
MEMLAGAVIENHHPHVTDSKRWIQYHSFGGMFNKAKT